MAKRKKKAANPHLREFYRLGLRVRQADQKSTKRGDGKNNWGVFKQMHEKTGVSRTETEKARKFVDYYTPKELDWLCELGSDEGSPLKKSHIMGLLNIPDKRKRRTLANRAAKESWSVKRLAAEIRKSLPRRSAGGRRPPRPKTVDDALVEIERATEKWLRLYEVLQVPDDRDDVGGVSVRDLPATVRSALKKVSTELDSLHSKVRRKIDARE